MTYGVRVRSLIERRLPALLVALAACSSEGSPSEPACVEYDATNASTAAVDFAGDVMPLFHRSCGVNALCHALPTNQPFLGSNPALATDAAGVHAAIVSRPSTSLPSMLLVDPGDAKNSFLMRKMDGDHCLFDAACKGGSCGAAMPEGALPLSVAERDVVRAWIAQGALE